MSNRKAIPCGHELRIGQSLPSALGGEAIVLEAYPSGEAEGPSIYFHGGHSNNPANPEKYLRYIAEAHRRHAFTVIYPNRRPRDEIYWAIKGTERHRLSRQEVRRGVAAEFAGAIVGQGQIAMGEDLNTIVAQRGDRICAIAQSVGALTLTTAATTVPEAYTRIAYLHPAGIDRPSLQHILQSGLRYAQTWRHRQTITPDNSIRSYLGIQNSTTLTNLPANVVANGENVLLSYHAPLLTITRPETETETETGLHVTIIGGKDDPIFPPSRIREPVAEFDIDQFLIVDGGHGIGDRRNVIDLAMETVRIDSREHGPYCLF